MRAGAIFPSRAAAAVRTFPRTARLIPMNPVRPEHTAPARKQITRYSPAWTKVRSTTVCRMTMTLPAVRPTWVTVWVTLVAVKKMSTARGTMMIPMVLN